MKDENKKSKKKVLLYYLILAACLLVIAAVTVTVIFTVKGNNSDITLENPGNSGTENPGNSGNKPDDTQKPDDKEPENPDDKDKPTSSSTEFALPVKTTAVTSKYEFVYDQTLDRYCVHQGMDFEGKAGDEVCAVLDGTVSKVVTDHLLSENYVTITHANGISTTYKYIDAKSGLKEGDAVKKGDVIGTIAVAGGMEMKQGEHLHFEVKVNGKTADPDVYLDILEK